MKTKKIEKFPKKAEIILKGAAAEFLANGYAATSMDRIAIVSKVSKATVYSYFGNKKGLFKLLIEKLARENLATIYELINPQFFQDEPTTAINTIAIKLLNNVGDDYNFQNLMRIIVAESGRFPELATSYVNNFAKPAIDVLVHYFKSHPQLNLQDEEATATVFIGTLVYHVILQKLLYGSEIIPLEPDHIVNNLTDLIVFSQ